MDLRICFALLLGHRGVFLDFAEELVVRFLEHARGELFEGGEFLLLRQPQSRASSEQLEHEEPTNRDTG